MSLYTKYRPKTFNELVDQDFIKNTLQKAVLENKTV
jgi:DNA polymerase III gamma/tau subunit